MKKSSTIDSNKNILGGTTVVAGTRIPIARILYLLSQGYTIENIQSEYPQLSAKKIKAVIATIAKKAEEGSFIIS